LYDNIKPIPEVVEALAGIVGDVKVVFCSMCRPEHLKSKKNFIDREIGQFLQVLYGFVDTADKDTLKADIFIDDRHNFLNMADSGAVKIKVNTPYTQDEELRVPVITTNSWLEIKGVLKTLGHVGEGK
jgi:5'(3')-deoxyribonucleotidase